MTPPNDSTIEQLVRTEAHVHYGEPPPEGVQPFVAFARSSPVLISAPHGSRTFRDDGDERWHEEDEYTSGMALLLSERCGTSVIANVWCSEHCDPNAHEEAGCAYKRRMREVVQQQRIRWVLDLHGAREDNPQMGRSLVDLGTRKRAISLETAHRDKLRELITSRFGAHSVSLDAFPASQPCRVTAFCQEKLGIQAIQIEMKPSVRVPFRRTDASSYGRLGPFSAPAKNVIAMLSALEDFIRYLQGLRA